MTLDEIIEALKGHRIETIASETGLHYNTVRKYVEGRAVDPPASTLQKLEAFVRDHAGAAS